MGPQDLHDFGRREPVFDAGRDPAAGVAVAPRAVRRGFSARLSRALRLPVLTGLFVAAVGAVSVAALMIYFTILIPNPMALRKGEPAPVIRILGHDGTLLAERGQAYDYMPIDLLPQHVVDAVVATEDRRFYHHWGIDPIGLARAAYANLRARRFVQGGSTLTQQLAKNLFLSPERRLGRKFEELILALFLEVRLKKREILELYLNRVYFGGGAFGIEAAARRYFNKSARDLDVTEAAVIAGLLKAPSKYAPSSSPVLARARARVVLAKMAAAGMLSAEQERAIARQPIRFAEPPAVRDATGLEYAIDYVLERLPRVLGPDHRQVIVETTIDDKLQRAAADIVLKNLTFDGDEMQAGQAGVVVLDTAGGMRALIGGRSHGDSQFNRAIKAKRQPGSAFKTFVYLAALESGLTPDSVVYDLPLTINGWSPRNESGTYRGAVSLRQGLAQSINTVAVRLHLDIGTRKAIAVAHRLGIASDLRDGPSLALGASEVTLLEMTTAYGAFASGGMALEPHIIRRVSTSAGRLIYERPATEPRRVVAAAEVGAMSDMLNAVLTSGTGRRAGLPLHPAAGKTGTSQDFRDAWFVGYSAHLVGGVWIGNDNGRPMNRVMGGTVPARIWREIMLVAHQGLEPQPLPGTTIPPPKPKTAEAPMLPRERIDEQFFERALAESAAAPATALAAGGRGLPATANDSYRPASAGAAKAPAGPDAGAPMRSWFGFSGLRLGERLGWSRAPARTGSDADRMGLGGR